MRARELSGRFSLVVNSGDKIKLLNKNFVTYCDSTKLEINMCNCAKRILGLQLHTRKKKKKLMCLAQILTERKNIKNR